MFPGITLPLGDVLTLMIIVSDNVAANLAIRRVGMGNVNSYMRELGLKKTALQRRLMDFEARRRGLDNTTSPCDMADLLERLVKKSILDENSCGKALE